MKRKIAIFLVLAMLFALVGCGQQTGGAGTQKAASAEEQMEQTAAQNGPAQDEQNDTEDLLGYDFDTDDGIDNSNSNASISGTKNADGTYTHNVDGYELILRTNLADYIKYDHVFYFKQLAADLGWHTKKEGQDENPDWAGYYWGDDDSCLVIFDSPSGFYHYSISYDYINGDAMVVFKRYDKDNSDITSFQVNPNGTMKANYEQLVVITYLLENIPINPNEDPFEEIQGSVQGYWTVYK